MVFRLLQPPTGRLCQTSHQSPVLAILLGSALPSLPGTALHPFYCSFLLFILCLLLQHLFLRYERHVQEGGDPDFDKYLLTLVDLLDFLPDDNSETLRKRRAGSSKAAQDKRKQAAEALQQT